MAKHILFCKSCNKYTLKEKCPECQGTALSTKPAKYSPEDKWGKYRLRQKKDAKKE